MRGLDTNVLLRYLTADEPRQCAAAERVIEECLTKRGASVLDRRRSVRTDLGLIAPLPANQTADRRAYRTDSGRRTV